MVVNVFDAGMLVALGASILVGVLVVGYREITLARIVTVAVLAGAGAFLIHASYVVAQYTRLDVAPSLFMALGVTSAVGALLAYHVWFWHERS